MPVSNKSIHSVRPNLDELKRDSGCCGGGAWGKCSGARNDHQFVPEDDEASVRRPPPPPVGMEARNMEPPYNEPELTGH